MKKIKTIFVIGGGTAGHTLPALELSKALLKKKYKVIFITDSRMLEFAKKNIKNKNIKVLCIKGRGIYKGDIIRNLKSLRCKSTELIVKPTK